MSLLGALPKYICGVTYWRVNDLSQKVTIESRDDGFSIAALMEYLSSVFHKLYSYLPPTPRQLGQSCTQWMVWSNQILSGGLWTLPTPLWKAEIVNDPRQDDLLQVGIAEPMLVVWQKRSSCSIIVEHIIKWQISASSSCPDPAHVVSLGILSEIFSWWSYALTALEQVMDYFGNLVGIRLSCWESTQMLQYKTQGLPLELRTLGPNFVFKWKLYCFLKQVFRRKPSAGTVHQRQCLFRVISSETSRSSSSWFWGRERGAPFLRRAGLLETGL